ncbi:MAG: FAD-dependent oxidoreductase, partial [Candidatus Limnocylindria bacterium]
MRTEIVVIGGGIIGCAAAAILADRGARVTLVERDAIAAGASGRNLGAIQHPFDPVLAPLYRESLSRYRALADATGDFQIGREPAGLLLLNRDADAAAAQAKRQQDAVPELAAAFLSPDEVVRVEPSLRHGPAAVLLATGYPVPPASVTHAWARIAEERGAAILVGSAARPVLE